MAVIDVEEKPTGFLQNGDNGVFTGRKQWHVQTNSNTNQEDEILGNASIPVKGDPYSPDYTGVLAKIIKVAPNLQDSTLNKFFWIVTVDYSSDYDPNNDVENPLLEPAKIRYTAEFTDRILYEDIQTGDAIANSAAIPTPFITREANTVITYIYNAAALTFDPADIVNTVNDGGETVDGTAYADQLLYCAGIDVSESLEKNSITYRQISVRMKVANDDTLKWKRKLLNQGKRELIKPPDEYARIKTPGTKQPVSTPWPLDAAGKALPLGAGPAGFTFEEWNEYDKADWSALNLS